ncbi:hypothetical protein ASE85_06010 [Sphingobium sp. Leaf26]|nr:hypothetical protein ASE85_06010 [Sphingobium sp. Leaf26]
MGLAHFHLCHRDRPGSFVEIDLSPFHLPQFARTLEDMGCQFQSIYDGGVTLIIFDSAQEDAELVRIDDSGKVFDPRCGQCADQELRRITFGTRCCNCKAENTAGKGAQEIGGFQAATPFMLLQFMKKFLRRDIGDRSLSELCPHQFHKPAHLLQRWLSQPLTRFLLYQFLGYASEAVAGPNARLDAGLSFGYVGIDRMSPLPTGGIPGSARLCQSNLGIRPE